ncbi:MAG: DUF4743 domain-containing protein [Alphaproteobacteria bacterium]|nr:DUF4743 domain-containing protein [Alphaproteobacteria bacterium]
MPPPPQSHSREGGNPAARVRGPYESFSRHIKNLCTAPDLIGYKRFMIAGEQLGWIKTDLAELLSNNFKSDFSSTNNEIALSSAHNDYTKRTAALAQATAWISNHHKVPLRHELYPVFNKWGATPLAEIDRAAAPWFGVHGYGVHVNGFVRKPDGIYLWVGERAKNRQVDPGKLDNIIGGGIPLGISVEENLIKEAWEEAGLKKETILSATPQGSISYKTEKQLGLRNDTLFIFDLELAPETTPCNTDGEVAAFHLMPIKEVAEIILTTDRFKFNCNLVILDFLLRHKYLKPDHAEYAEISEWMKEAKD